MGIATGTPFGLQQDYRGPFTATKGPSGIGTYSREPAFSKNNLEQSLHNPTSTAPIPKKRSFFVGLGQDMIKTLSRVLCGSMVGDVINGMLKDGKLSLDGVVHSNFIEGFGSRLFADFSGALSERLFNGETTIFGIPIPKLPAEASSQILSNTWVHLWRFYTSKYNLTGVSAADDRSPDVVKFREYVSKQPWLGTLKTAEKQFKNHIKPTLEKFLTAVFGVKGSQVIKDESGNPIKDPKTGKNKEIPPSVNWWKLGPLTLGSLIATTLLPKDTQQFGFSGIYNAAGGVKSVFRFFTSIGAALLGRFESTYFRNVLSMNRNGFNSEACHKATVREKMLLPLAQYLVDGISALTTRNLQKFVPINGATLSLILRFPFELVANLLSSSLLGITTNHRVPAQWEYLGVKYWKPLAKCMETVLKPFLWIINPIYRFALKGILPKESELAAKGLKYRAYDKEDAGDAAIARFKNNTVMDDLRLFITSANPWKLYKDMKGVVKDANEVSKEHRAKAKVTQDTASVSPTIVFDSGKKSDADATTDPGTQTTDGGVANAVDAGSSTVILPVHAHVVDGGGSDGGSSFGGDGGGGFSGDGGGGGG